MRGEGMEVGVSIKSENTSRKSDNSCVKMKNKSSLPRKGFKMQCVIK